MPLLTIIANSEHVSILTYVIAAGALVAVYVTSLLIYNLFFHPLAQFPGPKLAAVSHTWYAWIVLKKKSHLHITAAHRKYGHVVRIAPDELSFDTVASRNAIYGHGPARSFLKSALYEGFVNGGEPSLVGVIDPTEHGKKRKFLAHAFSAIALRSHETTVQKYCDLFVRQIIAHGGSAEGLDITDWFHWFTTDIVGDLAFGESFDSLKNVKTHPWVALIPKHAATIQLGDILRRFPLIRTLVRPILINEKMRTARYQNYEFAKLKTLQRMQMKTDRKDFMSYLLDAPDDNHLLNTAFLTVTASTFVVAGSETTGSALAGLTYWLIRSPRVMDTLQHELSVRFQTDADITPLAVQELPYLNAVIEEGLRMFPPTPNGLPRVSPGADVDGHYVPAGIVVSSHPIAMNTSEEHFHTPSEFRPERWLEKRDQLAASAPFNLGPRGCIGRNLAMLEMRMLIAKMVYNLDMQLLNQDLDWNRDARSNLFWEKPALLVKVQKKA
ncbi:benzoate 4-monooxygenase cytochrome P450 [Pyrenochaeta sp. DS3sAY3a]|nr:benzoate 4-monooxygenase cytochrome P450 [Pyrenochaeta sp. DS3sAY3a]